MKTLIFKLSGPLQSWGNEANFDRRTINTWPTKSAIIGMLGAAFGKSREDDTWLQAFNQIPIAIRVDQPGIPLQDFHMVHYRKTDQSKEFDSSLTYRDYLQDATFVVAIGENTIIDLDSIKAALKAPQYGLVLGRRADPIGGIWQTSLVETNTTVDALYQFPWQASDSYQKRHPDYVGQIYAASHLMPKDKNPITGHYRDSICMSNRADGRQFQSYELVSKSVLLGKG